MTGTGDGRLEKVLRHANAQTRPVTGEAVGIDRAAVPDRLQGINRQLDDIAAGAALHVGDEADTTGIAFIARVDQADIGEGFQPLAVGGFGPGLVRHSAAPRTRKRLSR